MIYYTATAVFSLASSNKLRLVLFNEHLVLFNEYLVLLLASVPSRAFPQKAIVSAALLKSQWLVKHRFHDGSKAVMCMVPWNTFRSSDLHSCHMISTLP